MTVVAGVDFGTQSVRFSIFDSDRGRLATGEASYPLLRKNDDPDYAAQRHADHLRALIAAASQALAAAAIDGRSIAALAIDTTGSTMVPVDERLEPLDDYYLWCDHRAWREAEAITTVAHRTGLTAIDWYGGVYLAEFGLAKLWHWLRNNPEQRTRFATALEHCDYLTAVLSGITDLDKLPRSVCAMGHKWMWNASLGGLPSEAFLAALDPLLAGVRERLGGRYATSDHVAGRLSPEWASQLGLRAGIPIAQGALDAHWDAIGAGIRLGDIVNVIGTSTCIMAISDRARPIPGVSGIVPGSIHPAYAGIEAGLSAAGDIFDAIARRAGTTLAVLSEAIANYHSGQTGLLRVVWDNGDRTVLARPHLSGATLGWKLGHSAADELFAAIEGTAFHTRLILERLAEHHVPIQRVIQAGGIPRRSPVLNQVYANVLNLPVLVPSRDTTSLGSAIFAFLTAGTFQTIEEAQQALCPPYRTIEPEPRGAAASEELFGWYRALYFALGRDDSAAVPIGGLLPALMRVAQGTRESALE